MYKIMAACLDDSRLMEHRSTYWWHQTAQLTVDGDALVGSFFYIYFYLHTQTNGLEQTMMQSWYTLVDTICLCTAEPLVNMITKYFRYDFWTNAYTLDSIRTWTSCILLSLIWLTFVCVMLVFFRYFSKGHSPLNLKQNHHRKVTITHTCTVRFVYAVRNMQALLLMTFDNSYLLLLPWKLNKQTVTTTLFINLSTADNVLLIKPCKN